LCECVRNYKHICDLTSPGHRDRELLKNIWEETGRESEGTGNSAMPSGGDVLPNNHANVKHAWEYVGSDA